MSQPEGLELSVEDYHADRIGDDRPALSASIIKVLCNESPLHAWNAHPKLNPHWKPDYKDEFDLGSVVHDLMLEGGTSRVHLIQTKKTEGSGKNKVETDEPVTDYKTNAAKAERDEARAAGKIPILQCKWTAVERMVAAAKRQLGNHRDASDMFSNGKPEVTLKWEEDGILFKSRLDWLHNDLTRIDDLKTSGISANPDVFSRQMYANGYDIQAAVYRRAVMAVYKVPPPKFRFGIVETEEPHAFTVIEASSSILALADRKIDWAKAVWKQCLKSSYWPSYSSNTERPEVNEYELSRWLAKEEIYDNARV